MKTRFEVRDEQRRKLVPEVRMALESLERLEHISNVRVDIEVFGGRLTGEFEIDGQIHTFVMNISR